MSHLKCKLVLTCPFNPRSNLKDAINDEVLSFYYLADGLTIFVTLIGCSLSFYNAIRDKLVNRVESVASVIDTRLITSSFPALSRELDELMVPVDIVQIDIKQEADRFQPYPPGSYRPAGTVDQYRDVTVNSLKHPGMTIHLMYRIR